MPPKRTRLKRETGYGVIQEKLGDNWCNVGNPSKAVEITNARSFAKTYQRITGRKTRVVKG